MAAWFEKRELRRFSRVAMPIRLFITPEKPIINLEIFALGIDYFPQSIKNKIKRNRKQLIYWLDHIQEQKDILYPVFMQIIDAAETLGRSVEMISQGRSPLNDERLHQKIHLNIRTIKLISSLEEPAPRTYNFLFEMEKKLTHFFRLLFISLHKSTPQKYHAFEPENRDFKIDEMTQKFSQPSYQKIPLIQAIYFMNELVTNYCDVFQEINFDYYSLENPKAWKKTQVNISAGGIAALYPKRFLSGKPLKSKMYFDGHDRVVEVKTAFARAESHSSMGAELNAFYFEFPHPQDQVFLELEIEKYQLDKVNSYCLNHQFLASFN
ncbi:MAG: hypothetical protein R3254_06120 [Thiomicrorhabdus sp.]|nr:hypothetical protein [Thiomicrorhabdus sp.]